MNRTRLIKTLGRMLPGVGTICLILCLSLIVRSAATPSKPRVVPPPPNTVPRPADLTLDLGGGITMEMAYIPPGKFLMGDDDQSGNPRRQISLEGFYLQTTHVTVAQYRAYCRIKGVEEPVPPSWGWIDRHPMVRISLFDAQKFCEWVTEKTGRKVRLPKEEEWEKAARGIQGWKYPWGNRFKTTNLWSSVDTRKSQTNPVAQFPPNAYGLYDMAGNVWQWCDSDPEGAGKYRILRGGSWFQDAEGYFRTSYRLERDPNFPGDTIGFRCLSGLSP